MKKDKHVTLRLVADTSGLDEIQEKLDELHITIARVNILLEELSDMNIELGLSTKILGPEKSRRE